LEEISFHLLQNFKSIFINFVIKVGGSSLR